MISISGRLNPGGEALSAAVSEAGRLAKRIDPWEKALVTLVALDLCFLPWAFGGVDPWSQLVSAGLALASLGVALAPRRPPADGSAGWDRLRRFPVFWCGLVLLAYVAVQGLNPALDYRDDGTNWWLVKLPYLDWLPAGMKAPFGQMNPWRTLVIWGACWATACALWTGITRRQSILALLTVAAANAFAFTAFGILQRATGAAEIYGIRPGDTFFAAIVYKNHAAVFLSLLVFVSLGLAIHALRNRRVGGERSSPAIIYLLFFVTLTVGVVLSFSLSVLVLFGVVFLTVMVLAFSRSTGALRAVRAKSLVLAVAAVLLAFSAGLGLAVGSRDVSERVHRFRNGKAGDSALTRLLAAKRGWEMLGDRWVLGWGAGCFRYGFTKYQRREPALARWHSFELRWEHVHNDWLELLIELGIVGAIPAGLIAVFWVRRMARMRLWRHPAILPLLGGLLVVALHAWIDFPLQNPAVSTLVAALLPLSVRWGEIEAARSESPAGPRSPSRILR